MWTCMLLVTFSYDESNCSDREWGLMVGGVQPSLFCRIILGLCVTVFGWWQDRFSCKHQGVIAPVCTQLHLLWRLSIWTKIWTSMHYCWDTVTLAIHSYCFSLMTLKWGFLLIQHHVKQFWWLKYCSNIWTLVSKKTPAIFWCSLCTHIPR